VGTIEVRGSFFYNRYHCYQRWVRFVFIMRSLHKVHSKNALWSGRVCLSVCPHDSTGEPLDGLR
jgi:hypothetical protein